MSEESDVHWAPSSRIENVFQKNEVPSHNEKDVCRRELSAIEVYITAIDHEVQHLLEKKARLTGYARKYKSILHPIRRLPYDVLREIFLACVEARYPKDSMVSDILPRKPISSLALNEPPWTLGQVSHKWRQAALCCPSLWTYIGVSFPTRHTPAYHRKDAIAHSLNAILTRSGDLPLVVHVDFDCASTSIEDPVLLAICSHSLRWEQLRFTGRGIDNELHTVFPHLSQLIRSKIPLLHSLFFDSSDFVNSSLLPGPIDAFEDAPSLQRIIIRGLTVDPHANLRIPWARISQFHRLCCLSRWKDTYAEIPLALMPNILEYSDAYFRCPSESDIINLSRLRVFRVSVNDADVCDLTRLRMGKQLNDFRIWNEDRRHVIESLVPFLQCWGDTLCCLCLDDLSITSSHDLTQVLGHLHSIQSLVLVYRYVSEGAHKPLFNALTVSTQSHLCPQLQRLVLYGQAATEEEHIVKMLSSRSRGDQSLQIFGAPRINLTRSQAYGVTIWNTASHDWSTLTLPGP